MDLFNKSQIIYRKDYTPFTHSIDRVFLDFELFETHTLLKTEMWVRSEVVGDLVLYGDDLECVSLQMQGSPLSADRYVMEAGALRILQCPTEAHIEIVTRLYPDKNTELSGLYRSNGIFCTQCEAEGFRDMTFFPDRPDVLTVYKTRITADKAKYPLLLSNGNLIAQGEADAGRHWVCWEDPYKKPSYLFALVAGDLACIADTFTTMEGRKVDLLIYTEHGNEGRCAHAMTSLKNAMRWDEKVFGRAYDLDIYMIVAVRDFNMGAMENKGLNIFNSKYILASPDTATDADYQAIESVVAHEYFHNWSGNRVTCRDWFQLSLKEGLTVFREQEFARDMQSRDVQRIEDVKTLRTAQFPEDAGAMAHPVRPESYEEVNNFYTPTIYEKGAEVIRMLHTLLGEKGFRAGMDLYFSQHDGKAVTIEDFVVAMEEANEQDLTQFRLWYSQAGTPKVEVKMQYQAGILSLTMQQTCRPTAECFEKAAFHIPIRMKLFTENGKKLYADQVLSLREPKQVFTFSGLPDEPLVSLLQDFSAPIILDFPRDQKTLLKIFDVESNGFVKWEIAQTISLEILQNFIRGKKKTLSIMPEYLEVLESMLRDQTLDPALRAHLITVPSYESVAACYTEVDVAVVEAARDAYSVALGRALWDTLHAQYVQCTQIVKPSIASRALAHACLRLLSWADNARVQPYCSDLMQASSGMTDYLAGFQNILLGNDEETSQRAVTLFYDKARANPLVLDKWFALQAQNPFWGTLERVKALLQHPDIDWKNPNRVRAVVGGFTHGNPRNFHALDGGGYAFLREVITRMDASNSQVAANMATPFTRGQNLTPALQKAMRKELDILAQQPLSRALGEIIRKSL
ncbi:MAG: aminopeptidase N [Legionellaceae bacterium]|nr:aminopeptidase N [Legionellaceae bacterium]